MVIYLRCGKVRKCSKIINTLTIFLQKYFIRTVIYITSRCENEKIVVQKPCSETPLFRFNVLTIG